MIADNFLYSRIVQKVLSLPVCVDLAFFSSFVACLVVAIKCSSLLLPEGHEDDGAFGHDRVDDESGQHNNEDGQKGEAKVELAPLDIPERMLQKESTHLSAAHLGYLLLQLTNYSILLRLQPSSLLLRFLHQEIIVVHPSSLYWSVT